MGVIYTLPPIASWDQDRNLEARIGTLFSDIQSRWRALLTATLAMAVLGAAYAFSSPNSYQAVVTTIPPAQDTGRLMSSIPELPGLPNFAGSGSEVLAILRSRSLAEQLVTRFDLQERYGSPHLEGAVKSFQNHLQVSQNGETSVITLAFTDTDPERAASIANAAADVMLEVYNEIQQSSSRHEKEFIQGQIKETLTLLEDAKERLVEFKRSNRAIELESQVRTTIKTIAELEGRKIGYQVELRALLDSSASSDNPRVKHLESRSSAIEEQIEHMMSGSDTVEDGKMLLDVDRMPELASEYYELLRETEKHSNIYQALQRNLQMARLSEARDHRPVTILDAARVPEMPAGPNRILIILAAAVAGAAGSLLFAALCPAKKSQKSRRHPTSDEAPTEPPTSDPPHGT